MKRTFLSLALLAGAFPSFADGIKVEGAYVPLAPPGVMAHAAYMSVENTGPQVRRLVGVTAEGYGMTHLHESKETDGVAVMSMVHQLDIAPGQAVSLKPGTFHVMLMRPKDAIVLGSKVPLVLQFADGKEIAVTASVVEPKFGS